MKLLKKVIFYSLVILSFGFLIISILTWNLLLGACSFVISIVLTKFLKEFGITESFHLKAVKHELKNRRRQAARESRS